MKPYKVLIFIACVMACLATLCMVLPGRIAFGEKVLRWPTLAEVFGTEEAYPHPLPEEDGSITASDTIGPSPDTLPSLEGRTEKEAPIPIPKVPVDSVTDSRMFLAAFYASLAESSDRVVRVVHYGDSQIEEDRMSQQIREKLQALYGGQGCGLMPLAQTIPNKTVRQQLRMNGRFVQAAQGPRRYLVYGPKRDQRQDGMYGVMGQVTILNDSLVKGSEEVTAVCTPLIPTAQYTRWKVFADTSIHYTFAGDTVFLSGRGAVYGLSQESEKGVIVDNIPMRGCLGLVFTKMDGTQLSSFYRDQHVKLIIMQFGGNAIPFNENPGTISAIVKGLREQVQYVQSCAPEASILFIGPSDMLTQEEGEWISYPMVPYMDRLLHKMALEENIAYFSLFRWMGGAGSMKRWQEIGLAGSDGVHFTRAGARKAGNAVAEWIIEGIKN